MVYMDNQAQNHTPQQVQALQDNQQIQPQVIPMPQTGLPQKEAEPIAQKETFVKISEEEPIIHPEVKEAGVEKVSDKLRLEEEHLKAGIEHAKESTPVKTEPSDEVSFPMTTQKANEIVKSKKSIKNSILWLATSVLRQIKIIGKGKK
ncbi:MAG: hypothetical protein CO135_04015 [Candidatus Levybacteria bacterium CG_4_9_14_3_um_filter_35_16]|nr:MAG: hypothetical protein COW87_03205 [Candidatus Levybacteria bacterium CG22_combo_CG10-13_8_21_14_all_35_11]PIZ99812.1 MAG: hypothetical protein COX78_01435 [Candidatus Levybacteria bacterium CG_4_10_14_0_2_um_filter_35_8]PJA90849.1 MAG: hypothetical protein CO135_04015 [Candidatus Levybacteria bacterium CG_4_9_14_3_um_filter_35_16]